jgi:hypothetical protein
MQRRAAAVLLAILLAPACGKARAPFLGSSAPGGGTPGQLDSGLLYFPPPTPPGADAAGLCGNEIVPTIIDRPNFYFVLDRSGSMNSLMPSDQASKGGVVPTRYTAARFAIQALLQAVGHRISYGAALFPGDSAGCSPGAEVFPTQPGDSVSYAISGKDGPTATRLLEVLGYHAPGDGATPTAASVAAIKPTLVALSGKTYAFLLTDGAPNCSDGAPCSAAECTVNLDQQCPLPNGANCCDPAFGQTNYSSCLDADASVQAVSDLASAGIHTFVVGMPGTDAYAALLDRLAEAGQTARPSKPEYYPVQSSTELTATLRQIGLSVAISCDIPLEAAPPDPSLVNVYFGKDLVLLDDTDGWIWVGADTVRVVGKHCDDLKNGNVLQVQVVAGCPSHTR